MKLFTVLCCLFLQPLFGLSQQNISVILDSITKNPIPFARVYIPGNTVYQTSNSKGEIFLDSLWMQSDNLTVFCYGYNKKTIVKPSKEILLSQKVKVLDEIIITAKKKPRYGFKTLGETDYPSPKKVKNSECNLDLGKVGDLNAVWIPNKKSLKGVLEKVNVYVLDLGRPASYFKLHFYACSKFKLEPGLEIATQNVIVKSTKGNTWATVDVSSYQIPLSENGIFIGIEWIKNEENISYTDTVEFVRNMIDGRVIYKRTLIGDGVILGSVYRPYRVSKHITWSFRNNKWHDDNLTDETRFFKDTLLLNENFTSSPDNFYVSIPSINIEVKYIKEKNKSEYEEPKKRKFNHIDKIKEDDFMYPQNTVNELFTSLIKAIQRNEVIYIFKYLCVYKEDQFDDLLVNIETYTGRLTVEQQNYALNYFKSFLDGIKEENIKHIKGNEYELNINGEITYLLHEKGKWKVNPYTYTIRKPFYF